MKNEILSKNYTPKDWSGADIKVGDIVDLYRVYEITWSQFIRDLALPNKDKPCWERIATFNVTKYKEGAEKLHRYFYKGGYDPDKIYDASINGNDLRHGCGSDLYILCIKGKSDNEQDFRITQLVNP